MISPNVPCVVVKENGTDVYGQPIQGKRIRTKCNVVKLQSVSTKSSVRADSSASRGRAHEIVSDSILLFPRFTDIAADDIVEVHNLKLRVSSIHSRFDVFGSLDHLEVGLTTWE